ncbi:MAG: DNA mismatch repair endonuclease MutL [Fimbriimonadaceae bacterium]|nr:DNA mismatch repair endonuclease MutL [Chitinophagales bacterium]
MADIIHLLPDTIANQIAAGEVIQRPASAVKELLENAVDAKATEIKLIVKEAGKSLMQVIDNGSGMSYTDARMCFEKHATSKIRTVDDLFAIRTMGFRGEALASIAAIAQVEMKTKLDGEELGTRILIEGFEVKSQEHCQAPQGTSVSIKNLFYNVPARRNFLKSNTVELKHIIDEFERVALAHPDIFFSMHHNGVEIFHLKPGNLRQRIVQLFGNQYNEKLVPIEEQTSVTNISGFIGKPESAKKTKGEQFFFVNNRYIRSAYLQHAILTAYDELLPDDTYPLFVVFIDIDPAKVDINVHPTKQEIKFEDERIIYTFIQAAIKHALSQYSITPTLDFDQDPTFANLPAFIRPQLQQPSEFKTMQSKLNEDVAVEEKKRFQTIAPDHFFAEKNIHEKFVTQQKFEMYKEDVDEIIDNEIVAFQIHNQYIITQIKSGLLIIDQQAAHERILFERYLKRLHEKKSHTQQQLFPKTLHISSQDAALLNEILNEINNLGFDIQPFGKDTFVVHGIPGEFEILNEQQVIEELLEQCKADISGLRMRKHETIAKSFARSNAVGAGKKLSQKEIKLLIDELFACATPYVSPHGNLTCVTFSLEDLAKQFQKNN